MFVSKTGLKKTFALASVSLYACGFAIACTSQTKGEYLRYLENEINYRHLVEMKDNSVIYYGVSSLDDYDTTQYDIDGVMVTCAPVIHYYFMFNAQGNYSYCDVEYELFNVSDITDNTNDVYLNDEVQVWGRYFNDIDIDLLDYFVQLVGNTYVVKNSIKQFYFTYSISYDDQNSSISLSAVMHYKELTSDAWTNVSMRTLTQSAGVSETSFDCTLNSEVYYSDALVNQLNYSISLINSYQQGVNAVLNNPHDYDLYTYQEYLLYGQSRYTAGVNAGSSNDVLSMSGVMETIFASPITMFKSIFGSSAFTWVMPNGQTLDLGGLMTFFLTIGIALAVVRLIMKIGGK